MEWQLTIARVAKSIFKLNSYVSWSMAALEAAESEGQPEDLISAIKRMISSGQNEHDEVIILLFLSLSLSLFSTMYIFSFT